MTDSLARPSLAASPRTSRPGRSFLRSCLLAMSALACLASVHAETVKLRMARIPIPEADRLSIAIPVFSLAGDDSLPPSFPQAARYLWTVDLRNCLARSGYWGTVLVTPEDVEYPAAALTIRCTVAKLEGRKLSLKADVIDAPGTVWFSKVYEGERTLADTALAKNTLHPMYANVIHAVCNDLATEFLKRRSAKTTDGIAQIAVLRFAADLSPEPFAGYIQEQPDGSLASSYPSPNDPLWKQVVTYRSEYDKAFVEIDKLYGNHAQEVKTNLVAYLEQADEIETALAKIKTELTAELEAIRNDMKQKSASTEAKRKELEAKKKELEEKEKAKKGGFLGSLRSATPLFTFPRGSNSKDFEIVINALRITIKTDEEKLAELEKELKELERQEKALDQEEERRIAQWKRENRDRLAELGRLLEKQKQVDTEFKESGKTITVRIQETDYKLVGTASKMLLEWRGKMRELYLKEYGQPKQ